MPGATRRGGGGAKRHARTDRDGDVTMDAATKSRGRIGKSKASKDTPSRTPKNGVIGKNAQRNILRQAAAGDVNMKEGSKTLRTGTVELQITGWTKSKASDGNDRGVSALIKWLEKKASLRLGSGRREVRIRKSRVVEDDLFVTVPEQDATALKRMNGYGWAGATIYIKRTGGNDDGLAVSSEAEKTKAMLRGVLERRYNPDIKFLDLSALGQDEELKSQQIFDNKSTASKFFPAMMKVLSMVFDTQAELNAAIESVSLANNELGDLKSISSLSETLPKLHNLDLSNNKFENLASLDRWRKRYLHLQHIIINNNPLEQNEPEYATTFLKWYPELRMINNVQVRTEEELAAASYLPFPIKSPLFFDVDGIGEQFIRTWFLGFDTDRRALANMYYDHLSDFSYALNTAAPRDPSATISLEKQEWDYYIKNSRNLKKISQLPARVNREFHGPKDVGDLFDSLPKTKHPDLGTEASKWIIEGHAQTGIPNITTLTPGGVDGFRITLSGEYDELDDTTGQPTKKRSCDHSIVLGPGGPTGVRVVSHHITIRAYGGTQAFQAPAASPSQAQSEAVQNNETLEPPILPSNLTLEVAEAMVFELTKRTNMTLPMSKTCLEQTGWDFDTALAAFESVKGTLTAEAFNAVPVA
ncbi:mRNA export factor mex67 like protein [Zymoseptoria brevis]|uniref:mRNA export factor MEX67 n=1 Tax=Zymoseptoria brevis TaxID=1047168 RepID=A0A0F4GSI1_9PEZI|nr:mRNA export factor mex67 like protein [Zymoseptoria brevis]